MVLTSLLLLAAGPGQAPPTIDWAMMTERQTVVDRQAGQYLGHVSSVQLPGGDVLIAYPQGHGRGSVVMKRSTNGGRNWSDRLPTPSNWAQSQETPTLHRLVDPRTGRARLIMWSGLYPALIATSEDDGKNWTPLRQVGDWGGIVVMGSVTQRADGTVIAWFHDDGRFLKQGGRATGEFKLLQTESTDMGDTWSEPRVIQSSRAVHLCEPGFIASPDGQEWALLLRENRRQRPSQVVFSRDEGRTWSSPRPLHPSLSGDRHTLRYLPDGRLVAVYRDMADGPTKGDFVAWLGHYEDFKNGRAGQARFRLLDNQNSWDCGYPGLELLPDGSLLAITYGHWEAGQSPFIKAVWWSPEDMDQARTLRQFVP
ncbi:hypothetical protein CCB81_05240 [Armatimonadetes bacterium Uphvl-Ar2]|nr:hypothetical protein CCB81_05240 [Armatimonadetes bacterium Uphvl-Ar2]